MIVCSIRSRALICAILCGISAPPTLAQEPVLQTLARTVTTRNVVADAIQEGSLRFHIPIAWLRLVMRAESNGDAKSVSDKGAIGLMQVMPATYEELRVKHGLGPDPFDPRDNILAGAAYLAEMFGRYGSSGFLAAYNAGPRRYEDYLSGRPLPLETTDYVARLAPQLGFVSLPVGLSTAPIRAPGSPIFFAALAQTPSWEVATRAQIEGLSRRKKVAPHPLFPAHSDDKIFAQETRSIRTSSDAKAAASVQAANLFVAHSALGAP